MYNFCYYNNNNFKLLLVKQEQYLHSIHFIQKNHACKLPSEYIYDPEKFADIRYQLDLYFAKKLQKFTIPLFPVGTIFEKKVWHALKTIPYGKTLSYGLLAKSINHNSAARAVGQAANKNPIPIIIPCHRLIGHNGNLVGFSAGLPVKIALLKLEGYL